MYTFDDPTPPLRDFLSEMEAQPVSQTHVRFWRDLYTALAYGPNLGSLFGPAFAPVLWVRSNELLDLREALLRRGIEHSNPGSTLRYLRFIRNEAAAYLPVIPKTHSVL